MHSVLLIDDDERLAPPLKDYMARYDLNLINETHPLSGLQRLQQGDVDLVILDIMLPEMDGFEVCRTIRKDSEIPIIMLTARGEVTDRIVGLELGADDYLPKPFDPRELVARIHRILKRATPTQTIPHLPTAKNTQTRLQFEHLSIDTEACQVRLDQQSIELTSKEYALLLLLSQAAHKVFSRDEIMNALSGIDAELFSRSVDILVSRLRQKLKPLNCIQTVWGKGYRFIAKAA